MDTLQKRCAYIVESTWFITLIIIFIVINAIFVGLETYPRIKENYFPFLFLADRVLLWIFTIEIVIRFLGSKSVGSFVKDPWNIFDFLIVFSSHLFAGFHYVTVLRVLRVLRILRTVSVIPSLRKMVSALLLTIPSMGTILLLLGIFFYIYAIIGTMVFHDVAPEYFGTLHNSLLTLFQIITMDSWSSGIMRQILEDVTYAWVYFISFVIIGAFIIINLFVGVVVNNVEKASRQEEPSPIEVKLNEVHKEIREMRKMLEKDRM